MEYITLMGAEDVQRAGSKMISAADQMRNASNDLSETLIAHQRFLDDWLCRFEEILTANQSVEVDRATECGCPVFGFTVTHKQGCRYYE